MGFRYVPACEKQLVYKIWSIKNAFLLDDLLNFLNN